MPLIQDLPDLAATAALAARIAPLLRSRDTILLEGPLGAGKTAFARALLRLLAEDPALEVPSPSYTLVQSYATRLGPVHHFDLWRLAGPAALIELGWEEARADVVLVEWPDRLGLLRPADALTIAFEPTGEGTRRATLSGWPDRLAGLGETSRAQAIAGFLARHGREPAGARPLAEDASFRRYLRVPPDAVLMDAPPEREDVRPFLQVQAHMAALGLSVPVVLAAEAHAGLVLLEDLGDALYPAVLSPANTQALYDTATDALAVLHAAAPPPGLPQWNAEAMRRTAEATFLDWWWPACFGTPAPEAARRDLAEALQSLLGPLDRQRGFVHRDYFADNLFWLPDRTGVRRVGIIDFQDAAIGHPAYDLVSLTQDARRDLPDGLAERQVARYLERRPEVDAEEFRAACAAAAVQRHLRVAALWVRLDRRDGKPGYLRHGPRTWRLLEAALAHPAAAPLAAFLDRWVPPERRGNPQACAA